jgi:hypothetical protein
MVLVLVLVTSVLVLPVVPEVIGSEGGCCRSLPSAGSTVADGQNAYAFLDGTFLPLRRMN